MEKSEITLDTGKTGPQINHIIEDPDITTLKKVQKTLPRKPYRGPRKPYRGRTGSENTIKRSCSTNTTKRKTDTDPLTTIG